MKENYMVCNCKQVSYSDIANALDNLINLGTREMLNYAHSNDIAVQYWTVNNEYYVKKLAENGADCVMTDYPQMAYEALNELKK